MAVDPVGHGIVTIGGAPGRIVLVHPDETQEQLVQEPSQRAAVANNGRGDFLIAWETPDLSAIRTAWYR
jgi:hypothetical protein